MQTSRLPALLAAAAACMLLASACSAGAERHEDGAGPLQSSPGSAERFLNGPDRPGADWSYGVFVCTSRSADPPVLERADVTGLAGGATFLGARFLPVPGDAGDVMATANGFPPTGLDTGAMAELPGQPVSTECGGDDIPSQIVLGLRLSPDGDGGFTGEDITYTDGGRQRILVLHNTFLFCGPNTTGLEACRELESPSPG